MLKSSKFLFLAFMATGGLLGYLAASNKLNWPTPAQAAQDEQAISFEVLLPANATLEIDGNKTDATGTTRTFRTPPLKVGGKYVYTLKAKIHGKEVTREIKIAYGAENRFDLRDDFRTGPNPIAANGSQESAPLGSAAATTTISGKQLPAPDPKFGGIIKDNASQSKAWWAPRIVPPAKAPNVLLIMTDDVGFGAPSTFGGVIPTPALDRIAKAGLRYTQFHSTALCSPTRAALITGRNHHSAGFGVISELSTGYPGYDSIITPDKATIGAILKGNGYATSWFGKNHNTPPFQYSVAGPFDQWPSGMGFDYFYGFMGGETDQWTPYLFRDHTQIFPWIGKPGYNLITDMADEAITRMKQLDAAAPEQPFFVYYVPGGSHSPHNPTKEWIDKFKGKLDRK